MQNHIDKLNAASEKGRNAKTEEERALAHSEFWDAAVDAFNDQIAGDVTLIDGQVITTPKIERTIAL